VPLPKHSSDPACRDRQSTGPRVAADESMTQDTSEATRHGASCRPGKRHAPGGDVNPVINMGRHEPRSVRSRSPLAGLSPDIITGEARTFDRVHACPRAENTCLPPRAHGAVPAKVWMSAARS
jgi:hypothetical protein